MRLSGREAYSPSDHSTLIAPAGLNNAAHCRGASRVPPPPPYSADERLLPGTTLRRRRQLNCASHSSSFCNGPAPAVGRGGCHGSFTDSLFRPDGINTFFFFSFSSRLVSDSSFLQRMPPPKSFLFFRTDGITGRIETIKKSP